MSKHYTAGEVATSFGISRSALFRDLQSLPHTLAGGDIVFTSQQVDESRRILDACPDSQMQRLVQLDKHRQMLRIQDGDIPEPAASR